MIKLDFFEAVVNDGVNALHFNFYWIGQNVSKAPFVPDRIGQMINTLILSQFHLGGNQIDLMTSSLLNAKAEELSLGVVETIVSSLLFYGVGIVKCLFNLLYDHVISSLLLSRF